MLRPENVAPRLWHVGDGVSLFIGPLHYNAPHSHAVPALISGLYDNFQIQLGDGVWRSCRSIIVPAGLPYALDVRGLPVSVLYLEPERARLDSLAPLLSNHEEASGALIGQNTANKILIGVYEKKVNQADAADILHDVLGYAQGKARRRLDPRIAVMVEQIQHSDIGNCSVTEFARQVNLSPSRLQHLFTQETGVPYRRYRAWHKLRKAIKEVVNGETATNAAHTAGYYDQSHFNRDFQKTFGARIGDTLATATLI